MAKKLNKKRSKPARSEKFFDIKECVVDDYWINNGEMIFVCRPKQLGVTVGMVLGKPHYSEGKGTYFYVQMSYVNSWARRHGVRTLINQKIFETFPTIVSGRGTEDGMAFMKAAGYKKDKTFGWILRKPNDRTTRT